MSFLVDFVATPLAYPFMQRALVIAVIVGVACAAMSCFLVLRGWSLMGDAVSHAILPGVVLAAAISVPLAAGAFVAGLLCALATGYLKDNSRVKEDTAMGVVFSGMFALGLVLFVKLPNEQHLLHILFGNMLGVSASDIVATLVVALPAFAFVMLRRRDLVMLCFDAQHARAIGLPVALLHYGLLAALALTIVASMQAVGVLLVVAMLVAPGAIAFLLTRRFDRMIPIATAAAVFSTVVGTLASFHIDGATGACIVLAQSALFALALVWSRWRARSARMRLAAA